MLAENSVAAYSYSSVNLVTGLMVSSVFVLIAVFFIKSSASAFSFIQSLKSRRVGLIKCFLTVKSGHDSFILGSSFCTAVFRSAVLFKSESFDSDLNAPTRLEMHPVVNDVIAIVHLQCWKTVEFVQMGT